MPERPQTADITLRVGNSYKDIYADPIFSNEDGAPMRVGQKDPVEVVIRALTMRGKLVTVPAQISCTKTPG